MLFVLGKWGRREEEIGRKRDRYRREVVFNSVFLSPHHRHWQQYRHVFMRHNGIQGSFQPHTTMGDNNRLLIMQFSMRTHLYHTWRTISAQLNRFLWLLIYSIIFGYWWDCDYFMDLWWVANINIAFIIIFVYVRDFYLHFTYSCITRLPGVKRFCKDIEFMCDLKTGIYWRLCWAIFTPGLMFLVLVYTLVTYKPLQYKDVAYPEYIMNIAWLLWFIGVGQLPFWALYTVYKQPGVTLREVGTQETMYVNNTGA